MNLGKLIKYSLYLLIMLLAVFLVLTLYMYFFSSSPKAEFAYIVAIPVCIFVISLLFSRSTMEKGLFCGIEIWIVYFAFVLLLKVMFKMTQEISIVQNLIYLPVAVLGGILGVNMKHRAVQK